MEWVEIKRSSTGQWVADIVTWDSETRTATTKRVSVAPSRWLTEEPAQEAAQEAAKAPAKAQEAAKAPANAQACKRQGHVRTPGARTCQRCGAVLRGRPSKG